MRDGIISAASVGHRSTMSPKGLLKTFSMCLLVVGTAAACGDSPLTPPAQEPSPMFAKGGNNGGNGGKPGGDDGGSTDGPFPAAATILATANLASDGGGPFVDGLCGVQAYVSSTVAYLKPAASPIKRKDREACGTGRSALVTLTMQHLSPDPSDHDGDVAISESYDLISLKPRLDDGELARMTVNTGRCDTGLEFDDVEFPGANRVRVAASADDASWIIESQAYPQNLAACGVGGTVEYFHMDVGVEFSKN